MGNKNYENKPSRGFRENINPVDETATETTEPVETVETEVTEKTLAAGIVHDCAKLNLRSEPKRDEQNENVITELLAGTVVEIDLHESNDEFYKVTTEAGVEGFCMKQFIKLT